MDTFSREAKASAMYGYFCNVPDEVESAARAFDLVIAGTALDVDGDAGAMAGLPLIEAVAEAPASEIAEMMCAVAAAVDRLMGRSEREVATGVSADTEQGGEDWYERRNELQEGQVFINYTGDRVKLDRRVAGDGTKWFVADWCSGHWSYEDSIVEPGDLRYRVE